MIFVGRGSIMSYINIKNRGTTNLSHLMTFRDGTMLTKNRITTAAVVTCLYAFVLFQAIETCEISLCERYCTNGYYNVDAVSPHGYPCVCQCCPPVVCRNCYMRKRIVAPDSRGCRTCKCGWYF